MIGIEATWRVSAWGSADTALAWHYTSAAGFHSIVTGHSIYASSPRSLNDQTELDYGAGIFQAAWQAVEGYASTYVRDTFSEILRSNVGTQVEESVFFLSASMANNIVPMWQAYAGADGFCIGLRTAAPLAPLLNVGARETGRISPVRVAGWRRVYYDELEQIEEAKKLLRFYVALAEPEDDAAALDEARIQEVGASLGAALQSAVCSFKDNAFHVEREVRFVAPSTHGARIEHFRLAPPNTLIPHLALTGATESERNSVDVSTDGFLHHVEAVQFGATLPIREVVCGPVTTDQGIANVTRLLRAYGYADVNVTRSPLPLR